MRNTYTKAERVVRKDEISKLLSRADGFFYSYPVSLHWCFFSEPENPVRSRVLIIVPKKIFKKAHDRNRVKRKMREAFRTSKQALNEAMENTDRQVALALLFKGKDLDIDAVSQKVPALMAKFATKHGKAQS